MSEVNHIVIDVLKARIHRLEHNSDQAEDSLVDLFRRISELESKKENPLLVDSDELKDVAIDGCQCPMCCEIRREQEAQDVLKPKCPTLEYGEPWPERTTYFNRSARCVNALAGVPDDELPKPGEIEALIKLEECWREMSSTYSKTSRVSQLIERLDAIRNKP